jgi:hypothetical protein
MAKSKKKKSLPKGKSKPKKRVKPRPIRKPVKPVKKLAKKPVQKRAKLAKPAKRKLAKPVKRKPVKRKPVKRKPVKRKPVKRKPVKRKPAKRKPKKATKRIFERRPIKVSEPPLEFTIKPGAIIQDEAYATILARLKDAESLLPEGTESRIIIHPYADGSVDGELYVKVPEGVSSGEVSWDLSSAFGLLAVGNRYWISVGARYIIEKDEEIYRRFKGMNQVQTNYQRANQSNIAEESLILRRKILPGMERRYKREAHSIFIRLHWNPLDEHPKR